MAVLKYAFIGCGIGAVMYGMLNGDGLSMFVGAVVILVGMFALKAN